MGIMFPTDLAAWQRWQRSRHRLRRLRHPFERPQQASLVLHTSGDEPVVLFAADATTPAALASVTAPLAHLCTTPVAVVAPADVSAMLPGQWRTVALGTDHELPRALRSVRASVGMGHFLPAGAAACAWSRVLSVPFFVVQHGLLAPHVPPLPEGAHLLAFSERDVAFWRAGRADVTSTVIGSHLLWRAARQPRAVAAATTPIFLGQLHGAELPRRISASTASRFCRDTGAAYRPHPAEADLLSRLQHAAWRRRGIRFAPSGPLLDAGAPVVSIFSTGVLEAAAAGIPAWVTCEHPPTWLGEFWERYDLARWGTAPTPAPWVPDTDPAQAVAAQVLAAAEGRR